MSFSDEELRSVVDSLVPTTSRISYDALGGRRTDIPFNKSQEAALGVFVLFPLSVYYLSLLCAQRLLVSTERVASLIGTIKSSANVLRRRPLPFKDTSSLRNAVVALSEMETSAATDVTATSAYARLEKNLNRFLQGAGASLRDGTVIVPTPAESREVIRSKLVELQSSLSALKEAVGYLSLADADAESLSLQAVLRQSVFKNARVLLEARAAELEGKTPAQRLETLRLVTLDVLGTKAAAGVVAALPSLSSLFVLSGTALPYADSTRRATPASLPVELPGPYVLVNTGTEATSTNVLQVRTVPSGSYEKVYLPESQVPKLQLLQPGPFTITPSNNALSCSINGGAPLAIPLTLGNRTVEDVVADCNVVLGATLYRASKYFAPVLYEGGPCTVAGNTVTLSFGSFPYGSSLALQVGDTVEFYYGAANVGEERTITTAPSAPNYNQFTVSGPPLLPATDQRVRVGNVYRLQFSPVDKRAAVSSRSTFQLLTPSSIEESTNVTLGAFGQPLATGKPTPANTIASFLQQNVAPITGSVTTTALRAVTLEPTTGPLKVRCYTSREGVTYAAGTTVQLTASAFVTDRVVLRDGPDAGAVGVVTSLNPTIATFAPLLGGTATADLVPGELAVGQRFVIATGINTGSYYIEVAGFDEQQLGQPLTQTRDAGAPLASAASLEEETLVLSSRDTSLSSFVEVLDTPNTFHLGVGPFSSIATTPYVQLPSVVRGLEEGDQLEVYAVDVYTPTAIHTITEVNDRLITVTPPVDATATFNFSASSPPFARLKKKNHLRFEEMAVALTAWNESIDLTTLNLELNRLANVLLTNENPSDSDIGSFLSAMSALQAKLSVQAATSQSLPVEASLESILASYSCPVVPEVTVLLKTLRELGADRGIEFLLSCRFSSFFGMDQEDSSYAGNLQKRIREVVSQDMPVSKQDRLVALSSKNVSEVTDDADPETDFEDAVDTAGPPENISSGIKMLDGKV